MPPCSCLGGGAPLELSPRVCLCLPPCLLRAALPRLPLGCSPRPWLPWGKSALPPEAHPAGHPSQRVSGPGRLGAARADLHALLAGQDTTRETHVGRAAGPAHPRGSEPVGVGGSPLHLGNSGLEEGWVLGRGVWPFTPGQGGMLSLASCRVGGPRASRVFPASSRPTARLSPLGCNLLTGGVTQGPCPGQVSAPPTLPTGPGLWRLVWGRDWNPGLLAPEASAELGGACCF